MKKWLLFAFSLTTIFMLLFLAEKGIFLLYFFNQSAALSFTEIVGVFYYGLWLDVSLAGYLSIIPIIFFFGNILLKKNGMPLFLKIYFPLIFFLVGLLFVADLGIYENWACKLNVRAMQNIFTPKEMMASSESSPLWLYALIVMLHIIYGWISARLLSRKNFLVPSQEKIIKHIFIFPFMLGISFLAMRGGWQVAPMNESSAYFSQNNFANHSAINSTWYAIQSVVNRSKYETVNPYQFFGIEKSEAIVRGLYVQKNDSTLQIFKTEKPNIVFIQLESLGADVIKELGGMEGLTPQLSKIISRGLLFENIYASGFRTDQGLVALLSGFPAQPNVSIIWNTEKQEKLPVLTQHLKNAGYFTKLIYAGDILFSNMKAYVVHNGFEKIITEDDFTLSERQSKWGVYDGVMFNRAIKEIGDMKSPFFTYIITLTSHEPYDIPVKPQFKGNDAKEKFMSACYYTDQTIGEFFREAEKQPWYENTIFILCADHGHRYPFNRSSYMPACHHIPLIISGGALHENFVGKKISAFGSQTDIASTILHQLNLSSEEFMWSNDLLNPNRKNFSYFSFDDGCGWVSPADTISYSNPSGKLMFPYHTIDSLHKSTDTAKAYLQVMYDAYLKY